MYYNMYYYWCCTYSISICVHGMSCLHTYVLVHIQYSTSNSQREQDLHYTVYLIRL
jgi:hypothetical protein